MRLQTVLSQRTREFAVRRQALEIENRIASVGLPVTFVIVLDGAIWFAADMTRELTVSGTDAGPMTTFTKVSSYHGAAESSGSIQVEREPDRALIACRHAIILDDIYDSGKTALAVVELCQRADAAAITFAPFLDKEKTAWPFPEHEIPIIAGAVIPDAFLVGYGLDYAGRFRSLDYIAALEDV